MPKMDIPVQIVNRIERIGPTPLGNSVQHFVSRRVAAVILSKGITNREMDDLHRRLVGLWFSHFGAARLVASA
jgi:hypothetical protein